MLRGGALADKVGHGKTATSIALLAVNTPAALPSPVDEIPAKDKGCFFAGRTATHTTLVVVPTRLVDQWDGEFTKFYSKAKLKVLTIARIPALEALTVEDIGKYDVVIVSYQVLLSSTYQARWRDLVGAEKTGHAGWGKSHDDQFITLAENSRSYMENADLDAKDREDFFKKRPDGRQENGELKVNPWFSQKSKEKKEYTIAAHMKKVKKVTVHVAAKKVNRYVDVPRTSKGAEKLVFPLLEQIWWRRVIYDELHEVEEFKSSRQLNSILNFRSFFKWGLTGTPANTNVRSVAAIASLFTKGNSYLHVLLR